MGYIFILVGCLVIYYGYKIWKDFRSGKTSWRSYSSTELKTKNEMNRYKEIHKMKYENRE
jgi:hypothetical protein